MSRRIRDLAKSKRPGYNYITPEDIQDVINDMIGQDGGDLDKQDHYEILREVAEIAAGAAGYGMEDQECCFFIACEGKYEDYSDLEEA